MPPKDRAFAVRLRLSGLARPDIDQLLTMYIVILVVVILSVLAFAFWFLSRAKPHLSADPPAKPTEPNRCTQLPDGTTFCEKCGAFAEVTQSDDVATYRCPRCEVELLPPLPEDGLGVDTAKGNDELRATS